MKNVVGMVVGIEWKRNCRLAFDRDCEVTHRWPNDTNINYLFTSSSCISFKHFRDEFWQAPTNEDSTHTRYEFVPHNNGIWVTWESMWIVLGTRHPIPHRHLTLYVRTYIYSIPRQTTILLGSTLYAGTDSRRWHTCFKSIYSGLRLQTRMLEDHRRGGGSMSSDICHHHYHLPTLLLSRTVRTSATASTLCPIIYIYICMALHNVEYDSFIL